MGSVVQFRPFKIPPDTRAGAGFGVKANPNGFEFMIEDLKASGLEPGDLFSYAHGMIWKPKEAECGYVIPYFYPDGQPIVGAEQCPAMYRIRYKARANLKCPRYHQPTKEELTALGLPTNVPYLPPYTRDGDTIAICEGEKKTIAAIKHLGLDAIGIGGHTMWNHEWLFDACRGKKVVIIPDADVMRFDISRSYGALASQLQDMGCQIEIVQMPDKLDDWIIGGGTREAFDALPRIKPEELVLTGEALVAKYNLTFVQNKDGKKIPHQHSSNIMTIMDQHPAFPTIWENLDNARVYIGDEETEPGLTEMEIANYFQRNLGMDKVSHKMVVPCISAFSAKNARSPMLEWVRSQAWDGKQRLATWMIRHWGVEDTEFHREVSVKWLVGSCARMDKAGTKIDWIFIAIGPQGTGKTTMPEILFRGNNMVVYGHDEGKDAKMLLHAALCVGYDELDGMAKREQSTLKAMITCREDAFRKPYGATVDFHPRRSVLYGCGNNPQFLAEDHSGYRRWAIVKVPRLLDFDGLEREVGQLWAEAWELYRSGSVKFWEVEGASDSASDYVLETPLGGSVERAVAELIRAGNKTFTSSQLYGVMNASGGQVNGAQVKEVAGKMRALGWDQKKAKVGGESTRVWYRVEP